MGQSPTANRLTPATVWRKYPRWRQIQKGRTVGNRGTHLERVLASATSATSLSRNPPYKSQRYRAKIIVGLQRKCEVV